MGEKHNLLMPKLGLTMTEGTLTESRAEPGQRAREGEVLFVVETEKVANEIEASAEGCIGEIRVLAGATVPVGEVLATPTDAGRPASAATDPASPTVSNVSKSTIGRDVPVGPGVVATPLAGRLAKQSGIDLHTLRGSGPNVQAAASDRTAALQLEDARPRPSRSDVALSVTKQRSQAASPQPNAKFRIFTSRSTLISDRRWRCVSK
jgi:pyruvate dehydrogenase E2 component (dihydrolipoamide acetyltransferase)